MSLSDRQLIVLSGVLILIIAAWIPVISPYLPTNEESFIEFALLGENLRAREYFPNDEDTITIDLQLKWNLQIRNHIGKIQHVNINFKLLNSTDMLPNSSLSTASNGLIIYNSTKIIADDEQIFIPINWSISEMSNNSGVIEISSIIINNETLVFNKVNSNDNNFSILFELWIYNDDSDRFEFGWNTDDGRRFAWTQMYFKVI